MPPRILIVYAYYETDDSRRNLGFFCRHGVSPYGDRRHVIVINGACSIEDQIPKFENVKVLKRDNKGFDFGAWAHAFRNVQRDQFDYVILLNSSVTGPFLPSYQDASRWPELFTTMLNDRAKLAGITINVFCGDPIVQSMLLATDRIGIELLFNNGMFTDNDKDATKDAVIYGREIPSSLIVMRAGFTLDCLATTHSRRTITTLKRNTMGDIIIPRGYLAGYTLEPYDLCFFKTNRGCSAGALERSMRLADYKRRALGAESIACASTQRPRTRLLIVYAYHETPDARRNLGFFCRHGVTPNRDRQYVIVINGKCSIEDQIPTFENVSVVKRANTGFDFGAWAHAIRESQLDQFDYFVFLNSSVAGPFLPTYQDVSQWPTPFVSMLDGQIKLAGLSSDMWDGSPIVHSMLLCTDRVGLDLLIRNGVFTGNDDDASKEDVIHKREVRASKIIIQSGFRVDSLDLIHSKRSFSVLQRESAGDGHGDVFKPGAYPHGYTIEPLDVVFFKVNRGLSVEALERAIRLADYKRSVAAEMCFQDVRILRTIDRLKRVPSAWKSHLEFAVWLTYRFLPRIVVDLGVDYGASTYAWGASGVSSVVGVDWFKGDEHTGVRDTQGAVASLAAELARDYGYENTVHIWRSSFAEAADVFDRPIDFLHVDGLHTNNAVKRDLKDWLPNLSKDGLVVMHGIRVFPDTVGKRFEKLDYPSVRIEHGAGLGIASRDKGKIAIIDREWKQMLYPHGSELRHREFDGIRIQP